MQSDWMVFGQCADSRSEMQRAGLDVADETLDAM